MGRGQPEADAWEGLLKGTVGCGVEVDDLFLFLSFVLTINTSETGEEQYTNTKQENKSTGKATK